VIGSTPRTLEAVRWSPVEPVLAIGTEVVYLHPGQLYAAAHRCAITTVLGSCVAVCLYDASTGVGGVNHYLLPKEGRWKQEPLRCGPSAIKALIESVVALGAVRGRLTARIYGGAHVLKSVSGERWQLGAANVSVARAVLDAERVPVREMAVGGVRGRKLQFVTGEGTAWIREI
jgi:chemotaxis protein CheD